MCMRLHINLDDELVREIDGLAGARGRSRLIREAVEAEVERRRRVGFLEQAVGSAPEFAPWMTPERISEERKRAGRERERELAERAEEGH